MANKFVEQIKKIKFDRTVYAPLLCIVCYIGLALLNLLDSAALALKDNIFLAIIVLQILIFMIPGTLYCKMAGKSVLRHINFKTVGLGKVLFCVTSYFVLFLGSTLIKFLIYHLGYYTTNYTVYQNYVPASISGLRTVVYVVLAVGILPAITEEFIFRGIVMQEYRSAGASPACAMVFSSLLFAMMHFSIAELPVYFFGGMIFAIAYLVTDSIIGAMIMHLLSNTLGLFFETTILRIISQADSIVFILFVFFSTFVLFLGLSLLLASRLLRMRAESGAKFIFKPLTKKQRKKQGGMWLESLISPSFIVCVIIFIIMTFAIK